MCASSTRLHHKSEGSVTISRDSGRRILLPGGLFVSRRCRLFRRLVSRRTGAVRAGDTPCVANASRSILSMLIEWLQKLYVALDSVVLTVVSTLPSDAVVRGDCCSPAIVVAVHCAYLSAKNRCSHIAPGILLRAQDANHSTRVTFARAVYSILLCNSSCSRDNVSCRQLFLTFETCKMLSDARTPFPGPVQIKLTIEPRS